MKLEFRACKAFLWMSLLAIILFSCKRRGYTIYIKIFNNPHMLAADVVNVRFRGVTIGNVIERKTEADFLIFKAIINDSSEKLTYSEAFYRKDLLGNVYIELVQNDSNALVNKKAIGLDDTVNGYYAPLFHEVDSTRKEQIIKEIKKVKEKLDSLVE